ncbi:MAG: carboxy terminal-processing peptidase [Gammaproteobacteria bacterium]|nr:carboxy terminal-processing peptidase [Gammaproteobacteria bacterium]
MLKRLTLGLVPILVATSAFGLPTKYKIDEIPVLSAEPQHKVSSTRVTALFTRTHFKEFELNNEFSSKIFDRFIESMDYNKNIFIAADVKLFEPLRFKFDEILKQGQLEDIYKIYQLNLQRRFERFSYALKLLDKPMDFDIEDNYQFDRDKSNWSTSTAQLNELWRQRVKSDALNLKLTGKDWSEISTTLAKRYNNALKRIIQTKSEDVFQLLMNSFSRSIDPHTSYLSPRNAERFQVEMSLSLEGIGAVLQVKDDYTVIQRLVSGGPADNSEQLGPEDKIIGVAQGDKEMIDIIGWRLDDVVELIKGPKGSTVRLEIISGKATSTSKSKIVPIVRDTIKLEDRAAKAQLLELQLPQFKDRKVGVITIPSFYVNLTNDVKKLIADLEQQGSEGLIIDLRNNGGGALTEATNLSGLFIESGPIVQVKSGNSQVDVRKDPDQAIHYQGPVTVLVNRYSASASEIFAAALQDYDRAIVVGEQTFGKGTVQQHRSLSRIYDFYEKPIGFVQYTIQKFYRINGGSTQNKGVVPDIAFPTAINPADFGESVADNTLPWDSINKAAYIKRSDYRHNYLNQLAKNHHQRIADNIEFQFLAQDIKRYQQEKDKKTVSLVESIRQEKRQLLDKTTLDRANIRRKNAGLEQVASLDDLPKKAPELDPVLDEASFIMLDYIDLGKTAKS